MQIVIVLLVHCLMASMGSAKKETLTNITSDQSALLVFKQHISSDPNKALQRNWSANSSVCDWIGVTCSIHQSNRVTGVNISFMGLTGTIPPSLGNLSFLVSLDLSGNKFHGNLPGKLSHLLRLTYLNLTLNNLTGEIPSWLGSFPELQHLSIRHNGFTGTVPHSVFNISKLETLDLSHNLLQGKIPGEVRGLKNLRYLSMQYNQLTGSIPPTIFNISTLETIAFTGNGLSGYLPADMCHNLPSLRGLHLISNKLNGELPSNLSGCSLLQKLQLSSNGFRGNIPSAYGTLKKIDELFLSHNRLEGVIPKEIGDLISLKIIALVDNRLTGSIPREIGNLTMLKALYLAHNHLKGEIPDEVGFLEDLEVLSIPFNSLTGFIPTGIFNITALRILTLNFNRLSGHLPTTNMGLRLPNLETLYLNANNISGSIPDSISNSSKLTFIALSSNKFTGSISSAFGNLQFLEHLVLFNNLLTKESSSLELKFITSLSRCRHLREITVANNFLNGFLPDSIGNLSSSLEIINAQRCSIKGRIPETIGNLSSLILLALHLNHISASIPSAVLEALPSLQRLTLQRNNITGSIPNNICDLRDLYFLDLRENQISGAIPGCLGNATSLRYLHLASNKITSQVPESLWKLKDLLELGLSSNFLTGSVSIEIGLLKVATWIAFSQNQFSDIIPSTIGALQNLKYLYLANNNFVGSIPESVSKMLSLEHLDLSHNNLSGFIPKSLETIRYLNYLNVSFNSLEGEIPANGSFKNFTSQSFMFNKALCGPPRFHVPPCRAPSVHGSRARRVLLYALFGVLGLATIIVALGWLFFQYDMKNEAPDSANSRLLTVKQRISYYELLQATKKYDESNFLGTGSFGSVYKGILANGMQVAVKVFDLQLECSSKSFERECRVLQSLRHRNLTKVIGSCSNDEFKALILDYMPCGSLEKWLYSHNNCLDIMQRLNVMIDVACALEYLHHGYLFPVVHCNLKPSNILLSEDMVARVTDFVVAKLLTDGMSVVQTKSLPSTLGHIAPEYGLQGLASTKCDMYSYGVMLMEVFTRIKPSDGIFLEASSLIRGWVENSKPELLLPEIIDPNLLNPEDQHFAEKLECIGSVMRLVVACTEESPKDRTNAVETLQLLKKIKAQLLECCYDEKKGSVLKDIEKKCLVD